MKIILLTILLFISVNLKAQFSDEFDDNKFGWTEISGKDGEALIIDGKMRIECFRSARSIYEPILTSTGEPNYIETHFYAPIDINKDFSISSNVLVKKINEDNAFGIILDYIDDGNYLSFVISEGKAMLLKFENYDLVGRIRADIKLKGQRKAEVNLRIKSTFKKIEFFVNEMKALEVRYLDLTSNGVGFYVLGQQVVEFDNLIINQ
ncbi:MAG: hypothetical protein LLF93_08370 [Bacteroidales bacterium]|nr:hypothetical protein [Bacteroidales bacterium]